MKKNRILMLCLLLVTTIVMSKDLVVLNDLQTPSIAEQVYARLEVSNRLPQFTNSYIDKVARDRSDVPSSLWETIKSSMDYSQYKDLAIQILSNNYSISELQNLLVEYSDKPFIPIEYTSLRNRLYEALQQFNTNIISQINSILAANNHAQITVN